MNNKIITRDNITDKAINSIKTNMNRDAPNTENKFRNVPLKYQNFCGEKPVVNIA
jgi:hypothetical protein